jgi:hypothetical protein
MLLKQVAHVVVVCAAAVSLISGSRGIAFAQAASKARAPARAARTAAPTSIESISETVTRLLDSTGLRDFVMCQLQPAVWGGYDVEVLVDGGEIKDRSSRVFRITKGVFSEKTDPRSRGAVVEITRAGLAVVKSAEEAFAKGVPFFITDVSVKAPGAVAYTVLSNPKTPLTLSMARIQSVSKGESGYTSSVEVIESTSPFDSKPEAQAREFKGNIDARDVLSVVTYVAGRNRCLVSNEVPLAPLLEAQSR